PSSRQRAAGRGRQSEGGGDRHGDAVADGGGSRRGRKLISAPGGSREAITPPPGRRRIDDRVAAAYFLDWPLGPSNRALSRAAWSARDRDACRRALVPFIAPMAAFQSGRARAIASRGGNRICLDPQSGRAAPRQ